MKENYFFAYLYIKSAKILAVISIIIGTFVCGSQMLNWKETIDITIRQKNRLWI